MCAYDSILPLPVTNSHPLFGLNQGLLQQPVEEDGTLLSDTSGGGSWLGHDDHAFGDEEEAPTAAAAGGGAYAHLPRGGDRRRHAAPPVSDVLCLTQPSLEEDEIVEQLEGEDDSQSGDESMSSDLDGEIEDGWETEDWDSDDDEEAFSVSDIHPYGGYRIGSTSGLSMGPGSRRSVPLVEPSGSETEVESEETSALHSRLGLRRDGSWGMGRGMGGSDRQGRFEAASSSPGPSFTAAESRVSSLVEHLSRSHSATELSWDAPASHAPSATSPHVFSPMTAPGFPRLGQEDDDSGGLSPGAKAKRGLIKARDALSRFFGLRGRQKVSEAGVEQKEEETPLVLSDAAPLASSEERIEALETVLKSRLILAVGSVCYPPGEEERRRRRSRKRSEERESDKKSPLWNQPIGLLMHRVALEALTSSGTVAIPNAWYPGGSSPPCVDISSVRRGSNGDVTVPVHAFLLPQLSEAELKQWREHPPLNAAMRWPEVPVASPINAAGQALEQRARRSKAVTSSSSLRPEEVVYATGLELLHVLSQGNLWLSRLPASAPAALLAPQLASLAGEAGEGGASPPALGPFLATDRPLVAAHASTALLPVLENPLKLTQFRLPVWLIETLSRYPGFIPFPWRTRLVQSLAFGPARALYTLAKSFSLRNRNDEGGAQGRGGGGGGGGGSPSSASIVAGVASRLGIQRRRASVSRVQLLDYAIRLFEHVATIRDSDVGLQFTGETGHGSGPTNEFFTLCCRELGRSDLSLWLATQSSKGDVKKPGSDSDFVYASGGLFPRPGYEVTPAARQRNLPPERCFRFLGHLIGKALQEGRLLDLPISLPFAKLLCGSSIDVWDVAQVDPAYGSAISSLLSYVSRRDELQAAIEQGDIEAEKEKSKLEVEVDAMVSDAVVIVRGGLLDCVRVQPLALCSFPLRSSSGGLGS